MDKIYKSVLLVDDCEADQLIARKIMQITGFAKDVVVKNSGQSALDFLKDARNHPTDIPDVIFLDLNMPILDGISFLRAFEDLPNEVKENCKIIVLSSSDNREDIRKVSDSGYVKKVLTKPLTIDSVLKLSV